MSRRIYCKRTHWTDDLPRGTCFEAVEWCRTQPSLDAAWAACERGDWMLWYANWRAGGAALAVATATAVTANAQGAAIVRRHFPRPPTASTFHPEVNCG